MSKDTKPSYASEVPFAPVNWEDRDTITRRVCDILEAVMPEGNQLDKTKELVKEMTKQYWITLFNDQLDSLLVRGLETNRTRYYAAIWEEALRQFPHEFDETISVKNRAIIK